MPWISRHFSQLAEKKAPAKAWRRDAVKHHNLDMSCMQATGFLHRTAPGLQHRSSASPEPKFSRRPLGLMVPYTFPSYSPKGPMKTEAEVHDLCLTLVAEARDTAAAGSAGAQEEETSVLAFEIEGRKRTET